MVQIPIQDESKVADLSIVIREFSKTLEQIWLYKTDGELIAHTCTQFTTKKDGNDEYVITGAIFIITINYAQEYGIWYAHWTNDLVRSNVAMWIMEDSALFTFIYVCTYWLWW